MAIATMTSKGQLTVPKEVRERLDLKAGDRVEFTSEGEERFVIRRVRVRSIKDLFGILPAGSAPRTVEGMDDAIGAAIAERYARCSET